MNENGRKFSDLYKSRLSSTFGYNLAMMLQVAFDTYDFRYRKSEGKEQLFDELRRKWVRLTPEEWVRQNWVRYLTTTCNYPSALIGIEKTIRVGELEKRFDLLVYNKDHHPWILIECKSPDVELNTNVIDQILHYHQRLPACYLMISNGQHSYLWKKEGGQLTEQTKLPVWG